MKHRFLTKILSCVVCIAMTLGTVFANPWYLEDGDITVNAGESGQSVSQGNRQESYTPEQEAPVITQKNSNVETNHTVTIKGGGEANVNIQDVNINTSTGSGIDVQGDTTANITANGSNTVKTRSGDAPIHVGSGELNLNTTEGSKVTVHMDTTGITADGKYDYTTGAGIGSNRGEDMSGSINLTGKGTVDASSKNGAGIGSGTDGHMTGTITTGEGSVNASSSVAGAGIGSGYAGNMSGTITTGEGNVTASSENDGAGIGSGMFGGMSGTITTGEGNVTASSESDGAGIGSGYNGDMSGTITTGEGNVTASSETDGAGIGSGSYGQMSGTITTGEGNVTASSGNNGAGIGSGYCGQMPGTITTGSGDVTASSGKHGAGIGTGMHGDMSGSITTGSGTVIASSGTPDPATGKYEHEENGNFFETGLGAALGSGGFGPMSGTVTVGPGKVILNTNRGAGIGGGALIPSSSYSPADMSGTVNIHKGADLTIHSLHGNQIGIGAPEIDNRGEQNGFGSVTSEARLNVEPGAILQGKTIESLQDILGLELGFPDAQVFGLSTRPAQAPSALAFQPDYWVVSSGVPVPMEAKQEGNVLTVTADYENAQLHITGEGLQTLKAQGIETVVFKTLSAESSFNVASVLGCTDLVLTHEGAKAELTLDGVASDLLS